jgi:hypothetical protein
MGLNLEIDAKIFQLYDLDNKNTVSTANKAHWERELNGKQSSNLLLSRKIKPTVEFLVIVHFNYFWNFRVFSGWTASGRPPTSFLTSQTFSYTKTWRDLETQQERKKRHLHKV